MPAQFNIAVPSVAGTAGAAVDVSAMAPVLTLLSFNDPSAIVQLQESYDAGAHFDNLGPPLSGAGVFLIECEGNRLRAVLISGVGGGNMQAAPQGLGTPSVQNLAVPAGSGPSTALDISAQPPSLVLGLTATDVQPSTVEISFDAVNFAQLGNIQPGVSTPFVVWANRLRLNRHGFGGAAGNLQVAGVPAKTA